MTTKEKIRGILEQWHLPILEDAEKVIMTRFQINYIQIKFMGDDDSRALTTNLFGFFTADDASEMARGLKACNEINNNLLQVKVFIDNDGDAIAATEFIHIADEDMEHVLMMAFKSLIAAKKQFIAKYRTMEEEDNLLADLEEDAVEDDSATGTDTEITMHHEPFDIRTIFQEGAQITGITAEDYDAFMELEGEKHSFVESADWKDRVGTSLSRIPSDDDNVAILARAANAMFIIVSSPLAERPLTTGEMDALREFVTGLPSDCDIVWGTAHDSTLGNTVKVIMLVNARPRA